VIYTYEDPSGVVLAVDCHKDGTAEIWTIINGNTPGEVQSAHALITTGYGSVIAGWLTGGEA
jgi:hypothetical protein